MHTRLPALAARRGISLALAALLAAAGCRPPAPDPPDPPEDDVRAERHTVIRQNGFLEIVVDVPPTPAGPKPAVVSYLADARPALLRAGFVVVTYTVHWELLRGLVKPAPAPPPDPDAPPPVGKWLLASPTPKTIGKGYLTLIDATARGTLRDVLDVLASEPEVDPSRIGIAGFSTNGFTALHAASVDPRFRVVVALGACGDYHRFLHQSTLAMDGKPLDLDPEYDAWLRAVEPVHHPERLAHAAILMVNGRSDLPIPIACARATARALRRVFRHARAPERFRFVVVDEGHTLDARGREEAVAWLVRWLAPTPGAR